MDVHHPENSNGYGIVHISGSGWGRPLAYNAPLLSEGQVELYGKPLVAAGYTVFSLNHRATPRFRYPAPLADVQRAVRFIRFHAEVYGIDPERIGAIGGSSGGHLVSLLGVLDGDGNPDDPDPVNRVSAKVQTVVARAAPADMARLDARASAGRCCCLWEREIGRRLNPKRREGIWKPRPSTTSRRTIRRFFFCTETSIR